MDDLKDIARTSAEDFYALLGISSLITDEADIKRAYRKASVKVHPDKNPDDAEAANKFILLGVARDILCDPTLKSQYDNQRRQKQQKESRRAEMSEQQRIWAERLEKGEREAFRKRKREEDPDYDLTEEEIKIRRIREDNKRLMREYEEKRERERKELEAKYGKPGQPPKNKSPENKRPEPGSTQDTDRTVKVCFVRDKETADWDKDKLSGMFAKYGVVDIVIEGKEKKRKVAGATGKQMTAIIYLTFTRLDHAYIAVADAKDDYPNLQSVDWFTKAPEIGANADPAISSSELTMMRMKDAAIKQKAARAERATKTAEQDSCASLVFP